MKQFNIISLILLTSFCFNMNMTIAQSPGQTNRFMSFFNKIAGDSLDNKYSVGIKTGLFLHTMKYSADEYDYKRKMKTSILLGLAMKYKINSDFSIKPEMVFMRKGVKIDEDDFNYSLQAKYLDINIPVLYQLPFEYKGFNSHVFAGPSFAFVKSGGINMDQNGDKYNSDITKANIKSTDLALRIGAGVSTPWKIGLFNATAMVEASYYLGLSNTFSKKEKSGDAVSLNLYNSGVTGKRKNRGIEISFSIMVPLSDFMPKRPIRDIPVIDVVETKTIKTEQPDTTKTHEKEILTVEQVKDRAQRGIDVTDSKIVTQNIQFETDKSILTEESKKYINDNILNLLEIMPKLRLKINGHTDNVGKDEHNLKLSQARAESVYKYLVKKGISADRLTYAGFGNTLPISDNNSEEGKAKNRRVEFEIVGQ